MQWALPLCYTCLINGSYNYNAWNVYYFDTQQFGNTALHIAADQAQREIVELLVNEGMNLDKLNKV